MSTEHNADAIAEVKRAIAALETQHARLKTQSAAVRQIEAESEEDMARALASLVASGVFVETEAQQLVEATSAAGKQIVRGWPTHCGVEITSALRRLRAKLAKLENPEALPDTKRKASKEAPEHSIMDVTQEDIENGAF